jgi:hypothetical protein
MAGEDRDQVHELRSKSQARIKVKFGPKSSATASVIDR